MTWMQMEASVKRAHSITFPGGRELVITGAALPRQSHRRRPSDRVWEGGPGIIHRYRQISTGRCTVNERV